MASTRTTAEIATRLQKWWETGEGGTDPVIEAIERLQELSEQ